MHKRDGSVVAFDADKIRQALIAAGKATGEYAEVEAEALLEAVLARLEGQTRLNVEQIQDRVERVLMDAGFFLSMRAYIVYREQHGRLRRDRRTLVEVATSMNEYLDREDWRVQANANQGYSLGGLILNVSGKVTANYWLDEVYSQAIGEAHREADLHIHDLDMLAGYCAGWSLRTLLHEGLNGVPGRVEAGPPKHLSSALGQMVNFSWHSAERMGRRPGVQLVRHLSRALCAQGPAQLRRSPPVVAGVHLQPQRAVALGHANPVHQPDVRLGLPTGSARTDPDHRRRRDAVRLR
nr:hypothetical protein GCM10020185_71740 [Pseudomonas brassicacearum subsp. brassicacearum]